MRKKEQPIWIDFYSKLIKEIHSCENAQVILDLYERGVHQEAFRPINKFITAIELLRELADHQNGPPLEQHRHEYEETMKEVYNFLEEHEK